MLAARPELPLVARSPRGFLTATVDELTAAGVRQFLDIGSGLPTADNTHEVAQRAAGPDLSCYCGVARKPEPSRP